MENQQKESVKLSLENKDVKKEKENNDFIKKFAKDLLTCPFCSEEYLFDFTMREHLERRHGSEIEQLDSWPVEQFHCPYCRAMFYYSNLIPKHIHFSHGKDLLDAWLNSANNFEKYKKDKENQNEPSVKFLDCSPCLSILFDNLDTCDSIKKFKRDLGSVNSTPVSQPRSILKRTPYSGKIVISSPQSAALHRTINSLKRSSSARRKLRFDLPPLKASPQNSQESSKKESNFVLETPPKKKKSWLFCTSKNSPSPINSKIKKKLRTKACKLSNRSANQMITSTPITCLDDSDNQCDEFDNSIGSNWKSALKTSDFRPLFLTAERFQCNFCQVKFSCNAELLFHQKTNHRRISFLPPFKCGQCETTFYRNVYLVRHCQQQHIPSCY
ncbi:CLUMA_CG016396, isoform A [Clunio marinus]|uniref:CLUMA_CG016396, isoform A n=1 Tax=Clunio marinus TaxID=568069 RepID=A0A1J1ITJ8_9DIPT|nr:CLUMA_CG016396, isoform A [Clunio marinus]